MPYSHGRIVPALVVLPPGRVRPQEDLAEQIVGRLAAAPPGQVGVDSLPMAAQQSGKGGSVPRRGLL
jgi:hypothetical protein